jgi:glutamyl-tRNA reductase
MTEKASEQIRLVVVGANHRSSSLTLRDRLFIEDTDVPAFIERLRASGVGQAMVLSTCDRIEVQAIAEDSAVAASRITEIMADHAGLAAGELGEQLYVLAGQEAVGHVFRVTSALDSLVPGEAEVLGQVKAGHNLARDAGMSGSELEAVLQAAYGAAKRVRSETAIGERPVSIAAAAVQVARDLHGDLDRSAGLLVGAGEMGVMVARSMLSAGLGALSAAHPTESRAEAVARELDCHVTPYPDFGARLADFDIVIAAYGSRRRIVTADMVAEAETRRRRKPMFLIDAAVPGDIDTAVDGIEDAFLYGLGDLETVALEGRATREAEAVEAGRIVEEEKERFLRGRAERAAVPTLTELRQHFETVRGEVLTEAGNDAEKATRLLVNRLLHDPSEVMREIAADDGTAGRPAQERGTAGKGGWAAAERVLKRLFRLGERNGGSGGGAGGTA